MHILTPADHPNRKGPQANWNLSVYKVRKPYFLNYDQYLGREGRGMFFIPTPKSDVVNTQMESLITLLSAYLLKYLP